MAAAGLIPMLGVPLAGGGAGTEALLAQAVAAASARRLVAPGSHVVAVMAYRGDLVLQARRRRVSKSRGCSCSGADRVLRRRECARARTAARP